MSTTNKDRNDFVLIPCIFSKSSLKDDDSGDHDQDQGSPKDGEKEKNEDEEKEQNVSKKKVSPCVHIEDTLN